MTLKTRIIPCLDVKDRPRRPQQRSCEDAQLKDSAVR
jgi:imidazole glycerol phosphate synthase subunit HisF